jgi:sugar-phosphatase
MVYGRSWRDIYADIIARFPSLAHISGRQMAGGLRVYYVEQCKQADSIIIPSSVALLKSLAEDYPVIVVSGSPHDDVAEAVRLMGAEASVRFVLGAEDYSPGKPSPAGFLLGAKQLGVAPEHCVVFEDSWAGVTSAKAAGMTCVALSRPTENPQDLAAADWVVSDLAMFSVEDLTQRH